MKVVFLTSEMYPFAKVGGLADVAGSLPPELKKAGAEIHVFMPFWSRSIDPSKFEIADTGVSVRVKIGGEELGSRVLRSSYKGVDVFLIENEAYYGRDGLYGTSEGDYPDNAERFAFFVQAVLEALPELGIQPDLFHVNDWESAMLPVYSRHVYGERYGGVRVLLTIHNLAYQGLFPPEILPRINVPGELFHMEALEFYGKVNFLKGGIVFSDFINTVSPTYAKEITLPEFGCGLEGVLKKRERNLTGILNGIDTEVWDPSKDPSLYHNYSISDFRKKRPLNKKKLIREMGLPLKSGTILFGMVSRLASQKGLDILVRALEELASGEEFQAVILGKGDREYEEKLAELAERHPERIAVRIGFDATLAGRIYGGADVFLMPSRYEPCGLGQMIALRYGSLPLVRLTGGLRDTVVPYDPEKSPEGYGFAFEEYSAEALKAEMMRSMSLHGNRRLWNRLAERGMKLDFSWSRSAREYLELYRKILMA